MSLVHFKSRKQELPRLGSQARAWEPETELFFSRYGIRRTNPEIWNAYDWFNQRYKKDYGRFSGIFDMNRYQNL